MLPDSGHGSSDRRLGKGYPITTSNGVGLGPANNTATTPCLLLRALSRSFVIFGHSALGLPGVVACRGVFVRFVGDLRSESEFPQPVSDSSDVRLVRPVIGVDTNHANRR